MKMKLFSGSFKSDRVLKGLIWDTWKSSGRNSIKDIPCNLTITCFTCYGKKEKPMYFPCTLTFSSFFSFFSLLKSCDHCCKLKSTCTLNVLTLFFFFFLSHATQHYFILAFSPTFSWTPCYINWQILGIRAGAREQSCSARGVFFFFFKSLCTYL